MDNKSLQWIHRFSTLVFEWHKTNLTLHAYLYLLKYQPLLHFSWRPGPRKLISSWVNFPQNKRGECGNLGDMSAIKRMDVFAAGNIISHMSEAKTLMIISKIVPAKVWYDDNFGSLQKTICESFSLFSFGIFDSHFNLTFNLRKALNPFTVWSKA